MTYRPPNNILEVLQRIEYEEALALGDPRYVDTTAARGSEKTFNRLARKFGLDLNEDRLFAPMQKHVLFFGHAGSGKTTELRHYAEQLNGPDKFLVVDVDIAHELDRNNLKYADVLMAMVKALLGSLEQNHILLGADAIDGLASWFEEQVLSSEDLAQYALEINSDTEPKTGIAGLLKLFTNLTAGFKTGKTYNESLRIAIRNSFGEFADAFNRLLRTAEHVLAEQAIAKRILFVIDGIDKLPGEDTRNFFVHDAEQLLAVAALVIYPAPLSLVYESNLSDKLDADLVLPMIKLYEPDNQRCEAGWHVMREMLLLRADRLLFAGDDEINQLIEHSAGHPREMLRLLKLCCEFAEQNQIDLDTVNLAIRQLALEFQRFLEPDDYALLKNIDRNNSHAGNDERTRKLLCSLALLEFDDGTWRRSHPIIRKLEGYASVSHTH